MLLLVYLLFFIWWLLLELFYRTGTDNLLAFGIWLPGFVFLGSLHDYISFKRMVSESSTEKLSTYQIKSIRQVVAGVASTPCWRWTAYHASSRVSTEKHGGGRCQFNSSGTLLSCPQASEATRRMATETLQAVSGTTTYRLQTCQFQTHGHQSRDDQTQSVCTARDATPAQVSLRGSSQYQGCCKEATTSAGVWHGILCGGRSW